MGRDGTVGAIALRGGLPRPDSAPRRIGWLRRSVVCGLAGAGVALGCASLLVDGASVRAREALARHGLESLPLTAQGPISAALGGDRSAYLVSGLRAVNPAQRLRVRFSRRGVAVAAGGARLGMMLSSDGNASALARAAALTPRASANRVSYSAGPLTEWFANGPLGLEQGFDLAARPRAGSGPLTFSLAISGNLAMRLQDGSVLLNGRGVALRYGGLVATDARGRVLRSWLQLTAGHLLIRVDDRGAAYPVRVDPFIQQAELTAEKGAEEEELGTSVAVSGNTIVVGAPNRNVGGKSAEQGEAYVFTRPSSGWADAGQSAELTAAVGMAGERLGEAVAVAGRTVVVGAPDREVGGHNEDGAAYVFNEPSGGWGSKAADEELHQAAELIASDGAAQDKLGSSVAVSGSTVVAGVPHREAGGKKDAGEAYAFTEPAHGWGSAEAGEKVPQATELFASGGAAKDELGTSVGVSGKTVVAGAPNRKVGANEAQGVADVFNEPSGGWGSKEPGEEASQAAELTASNGAADDLLGDSVAASGAVVVAGAPSHKVGSNVSQGAAYVFSEPGGGWGSTIVGEEVHQAAELTASNGASSDRLGSSIAISGQTVVAGAPLHAVGSSAKQGAAYVFLMPPSGWSGSLAQTAELTAADGAEQDRLGESVAVSGDTALAGAPAHKVGANEEQGAAYVYEEPPSVVITTPVNGATYTQHQAVAAEYSCPTASGTTVTCLGPVADGAAIETSTPGPHTFTVNATDSDALSAPPESVSYTVVAAPAPVLVTPLAPALGGLSESATSWREGTLLAHLSASDSKAKKQLPIGTTFSFTLNEPASVSFTFTTPASGRRVGKRCVAQTRNNRHKHRCTRTVVAGTLSFAAHAGTNKVRFQGLLTKHKKLGLGSHTVLVSATASGKHSPRRTLHFTIVV